MARQHKPAVARADTSLSAYLLDGFPLLCGEAGQGGGEDPVLFPEYVLAQQVQRADEPAGPAGIGWRPGRGLVQDGFDVPVLGR